jgi:SulP family sulfate permease
MKMAATTEPPHRTYKDFEFNLRELAGSMGDLGTLFPLAIGHITVCGLDPAGLFIWLGVVNIVTGTLTGQS